MAQDEQQQQQQLQCKIHQTSNNPLVTSSIECSDCTKNIHRHDHPEPCHSDDDLSSSSPFPNNDTKQKHYHYFPRLLFVMCMMWSSTIYNNVQVAAFQHFAIPRYAPSLIVPSRLSSQMNNHCVFLDPSSSKKRMILFASDLTAEVAEDDKDINTGVANADKEEKGDEDIDADDAEKDKKEESENTEETTTSETSSTNDDDTSEEREDEEENPLNATPITTISTEEVVGIGGKDGLVYDVNRLKRNLVQEAVREYKRELLHLLGPYYRQPISSSSEDVKSQNDVKLTIGMAKKKQQKTSKRKMTRDALIREKLSSLMAANPVSTTTDSNLIDGTWMFLYESPNFQREDDDDDDDDSDDPQNRFIKPQQRKQKSRRGSQNKHRGRSLNPFLGKRSRFVNLEHLEDDEDSYVIETSTILGGLFSRRRWYDVVGLSRRTLDLDLVMSHNSIAWGLTNWDNIVKPLTKEEAEAEERRKANLKRNMVRKVWSKIWEEVVNASTSPLRKEVRVLYLDTDLCITTTVTTVGDVIIESGSGNKNEVIDTRRIIGGEEGILHVYTKSEAWAGQLEDREKNKVRLMVASATPSKVSSAIRPGVRKRFMSALRRRGVKVDGDGDGDPDVDAQSEGKTTASTSSKTLSVTSFRLGEYDINSDGLTKEDVTWDGDEDPFVHLTADERQRVLKKMDIREIKEAGRVQKMMNRRFRRGRRSNTSKRFRKPSRDSSLGDGI